METSKKVILKYDPSSGSLYDLNNVYLGVIGVNMILEDYKENDESEEKNNTISSGDIIKYHESGITVDELVELRKNKLI